ncbi:MAG: hypothetical protein ACODAE_03935 [Gemmatimonadota bacterium]
MVPIALPDTIVLLVTSFGVCVVSGFVPVVNAELYLIAASAVCPPGAAVPLVVFATAGQMTAKSAMYYGGVGVVRVPVGGRRAGRWKRRLADARRRFESYRGQTDALVFASAAAGVPPFYATSVLGGVLEIGFVRFFVWGFTGRAIRFGAVVFLPQLVRGVIG